MTGPDIDAGNAVPVYDFAYDPADDLQWGVRGENGSVIECETRREAERSMLRPGMFGRVLDLVCRLADAPETEPGGDWRAASDAPLLQRLADVTYQRNWACEELAQWTGALR